MLLMSVAFRAQTTKRDEVLSAVDDVVARLRHRTGCAHARLFVDTEDADVFTLLSEFESVDDADQFFTSREFRVLRGIRMMLRDEPVVVVDDVRSRVTRLVRD
ncbi:MAG: putative quinol monooxygenase [Vicinamibacterales bacterium]